MAPKSRLNPHETTPDEVMIRCLSRIAEGMEAVRWLLIVVCLLLIGVIAANVATLL